MTTPTFRETAAARPRGAAAPRASLALALAAAALLAGCKAGEGPGQCYEPNARAYNFDWLGDTNVVFHWPQSYMPVRVYAESVGTLRANTQTGMQLWASAFRCRELSYTMVTDSTHADIIVRNPQTLPLPARSVRALGADSVNACQGVTQFQTDSDTTALTGPMRSYVAPFAGTDSVALLACYRFVTAHELGHALGMLSHSPDTSDLMYASPRRLQLSEDDRYTIQLLYHVASKLRPPPRR